MRTDMELSACGSCTLRGRPLCPATHSDAEPQMSAVVLTALAPEAGLADSTLDGRHFGILRSGLLLRHGPGPEGATRGLDLIFPGELTTEVFRRNRSYRVSAVVPSQICWFDQHEVEQAARTSPDFGRALLETVSVGLDRLQMFLWMRGALSAVQRMAALMVMLSALTQHTSRSSKGHLRLKLDWPRRDIANLIGTSLETISRATHELERRGLIVIHNSTTFELRDMQGLRELAEMEDQSLDRVLPAPLRIDGQRRLSVDRHQWSDSRSMV